MARLLGLRLLVLDARIVLAPAQLTNPPSADRGTPSLRSHAVGARLATAQRLLEAEGIATSSRDEGTYRFLCTGDPTTFRELGTRFLQLPLGDIERVDV